MSSVSSGWNAVAKMLPFCTATNTSTSSSASPNCPLGPLCELAGAALGRCVDTRSFLAAGGSLLAPLASSMSRSTSALASTCGRATTLASTSTSGPALKIAGARMNTADPRPPLDNAARAASPAATVPGTISTASSWLCICDPKKFRHTCTSKPPTRL